MRRRTLPLGIDIGTSRVRIAVAESTSDGRASIRAVAAREVSGGSGEAGERFAPEFIALVVEDLLRELGTRERRCVAALSAPDALLRIITMPKMTWAERTRAARFEAQRFAGWDLEAERSPVRVHAIDRQSSVYAIGVARREALEARVSALRAARLRPIAVDHDALALRTLLSDGDAILDVGCDRSMLHVFRDRSPISYVIPAGGAHLSQGIAQDLAVDFATAERRKRILGAAGAGGAARDHLVFAIKTALDKARTRAAVGRILVTGNGARLPGFLRDLERAVDATVEMPVANALLTESYPEDVIRAAAPDWTLAAALALRCGAA